MEIQKFKQTVYLPVEGKSIDEFMENKEGYFFTPEQLNEYTANVIKQALETAAEKVKMYDTNEDCHYEDEEGNFPECYVVDKQSIINTFEETFKKFEV